MDVSVYYVNNFILENAQLEMIHVDEPSKTAEIIVELLKSSLEKIKLPLSDSNFVTDCGSNILKACKIANISHFKCLCHRMNTALSSAWEKAMENDILKSLDKDLSKLIEYANRTQMNSKLPIKLKSGCPTRPWRQLYDKYYSLSRSYDLVEQILKEMNQSSRLNRISKPFINQIFNEILAHFKEFYDELEAVKTVTISKVLPLVYGLIEELSTTLCEADENINPETESLNFLKNMIIELIREKVIDGAITNVHYTATFLDKRFKLDFLPSSANELAKAVLKEMYSKQPAMKTATSNTVCADSTAIPPAAKIPKVGILSKMKAKPMQPTINPCLSELEVELDIYSKIEPTDREPLEFWKEHRYQLPVLTNLAIQILAIPASSAGSERRFSIAGKVCRPDRANLKPSKVAKLSKVANNMNSNQYKR